MMTQYHTISIPENLTAKIDALIQQGLYRSRAELVNELLRDYFRTREPKET